jgi:hypothetical protein
MRRARPHELKTPANPVLTARLSETELVEWLPVRFDEIDDPLATPEPSKGALIQLENGAYVVVYYGKDSQQLTLEIPETNSDSSALVASFFEEVPLPIARVLWHRPDTKIPSRRRRTAPNANSSTESLRSKRSARRVVMPAKRK